MIPVSLPDRPAGSAPPSSLGWVVAAALTTAAAAHIPLIPEHLQDATYMGVAFTVFTFACLALAALAIQHDTAAVYLASATVAMAAVLTYAGTRIVAFPMLADDVGAWADPLGVVAVLAELTAAAASIVALWSAPSGRTALRRV